MLSAALNLWEQAPNVWSFVAVILATALLILVARGPAYIAAWSARQIGLREQERLDRLAALRLAVPREPPANDAAGGEPVLPFPSRNAPRLVTATENEKAA